MQRCDVAVVLALAGQHNDLLDAPEGSQRGVDRTDRAERLPERHDHEEQKEDERDERRDRDGAVGNAVTAHTENGEERNLHGDAGNRHDECRNLGDANAHLPGAHGGHVDLGHLAIGGVGRAHRAHRTDGPLNGRGELAHLGLRLAAGNANPTREHRNNGNRDDDHGERECQEKGVDDDHGNERANEGE